MVNFTRDGWSGFNFILHNGDEKDLGGQDHTFSKALYGNDLYSFSGIAGLFADALTEPPVTVEGASAHWLTPQLLVMRVPEGSSTLRLYYSNKADPGMSRRLR